MKTHNCIYSLLFALIACVLASCSTTSRIPDDEILYTGLKGLQVKELPDSTHMPADVKSVLRQAVKVAPTKSLYGIPVGLWVYNHMEVNDSTGSLKRRFYDKFVQEPVLVSDVRPALRVKMLDQILDNNGYFSGHASYQVIPSKKNHKKAKILYNIDPGHAYLIDSVGLMPDTTALVHMIDSLAKHDRYLHPGVRFSMDSLSDARTRISTYLRNRGYYYFRPEYIEYLADSIFTPGSISLRMELAANTPAFALKRYQIGDVTFYAHRHQGGGIPDTIPLPGITLVQMQPSKLRHSVVTDNVTFRTGRYISQRDFDITQNFLSRLGIFNAITIEAVPDTTVDVPTLNVNIGTTFDMPLEAHFEVNASSKSNSYIGPGLSFGVTNHNLFGGGEQFNINLAGSYEWQTGHGARAIFNSYQASLSTSLAFPRLLAPKFVPRRHRQINWTRITLSGEVLNRPHYFKLAQVNTSLSYDWISSRYISNTFVPIKFTYNKLIHTTEKFDSIMVANPAVALSFQSQFIPQMSYTFSYDRAMDRSNTINCTFTVQEAGNLLWSAYELAGQKGEKELFGTPFSQFVKASVQVVYGRRLNGAAWLMSRVAIGAAHAYGNSSQVPYSEQFYCGGANSVRAFTVRSIGPGSYHMPNTNGDYFDQTGTFKFEANVEYRFPIYGPVNGALFVDSGNVWLLKDDPYRPGGQLKADNFLKDLALGTGFGIRFDIGMLVLRGDLGIGIHAPYDTGKHGYYNMTSFGKSLAFHLAIGYPF